jgi:hypothetical protein
MPTVDDVDLVSIRWLSSQAAMRLGLRPQKLLVDGGVIEIELSTKVDLIEIAERYELNIVSEYGLCPLKRDEISYLGSSIFMQDIRLNPSGIDPKKHNEYREMLLNIKKTDKYHYFIYTYYRNDPLYPLIGLYNLSNHPQDLCLRISGGNMGGRFQSNIVFVPKTEIFKLLESAGVK